MEVKKSLIKGIEKLFVVSSLMGGIFVNNSYSDDLLVQFKDKAPSGTRSTMDIMNIDGADNNWNPGLDVDFLEAPSPSLDVYSIVPYDPFRLRNDARAPDFYSTINAEIGGRGLPSLNENQLVFSIYNENYFFNKNIFLDLYDMKNGGNTFVGTYDIKQMVTEGKTIPIVIDNGLSYNANFRFSPIVVQPPTNLYFVGTPGTPGNWADNNTWNTSADLSGTNMNWQPSIANINGPYDINLSDKQGINGLNLKNGPNHISGGTLELLVDSSINNDNVDTINSNITGIGKLIKDGTGTLILSGTNDYTGGTVVNSGILDITSSYALPNETSLTVGAGAIFIFDGSNTSGGNTSGSYAIGNSSQYAGSAVPEPTSVALLGIGGLLFGAYALNKRR